jgi:GntR family transcriptional repressor for pyruvate dehydrogenase complex
MDDLAEARSIYEPEVARLAALRVNAEELGRIAEVVSRQEAALRAGGHQEEFDLMFHRLVAEATKNPVLVTAMNSIVNTLLPEVRELNLDRSVQKSIVDFHQKIYQALKARDPERAYNLMAEHVVDVQKRLAKLEAVYRSRRASST